MRRSLRKILPLIAATAALALAAGCGSEEPVLDVVEGEPLELGELNYNVQITRYLNPADVEDSAYLEDVPAAPEGQEYLATFMRVTNESEEELQTVPFSFEVRDTRGNVYEPVEVSNVWALDLGAQLLPDQQLPGPDTPARSGPIKGSMLLFLVDENAGENRPLELEIPASAGGETGTVELDI